MAPIGNVSARALCACQAMVELARRGPDRPVEAARLAESCGLSRFFLIQVFQELKAAGLVRSTRGRAGGFQLLRPPRSIRIGEIAAAVGEFASADRPNDPIRRVLAREWTEAAHAFERHLNQLTLEAIVRELDTDLLGTR